jgi:HEAT repeat protein
MTAALVGSGALTDIASGQRPADPVERLRSVLKAINQDVERRDEAIKEQIDQLSGLGDLRLALALPEWRDQDSDLRVAGIDSRNRALVAKKFGTEVREQICKGDANQSLAAVTMLAQMNGTALQVLNRNHLSRDIGGDLAKVVRQGAPPARLAAAEALARLNPSAEVAVPALNEMFADDQVEMRLTAGRAMGNLVQRSCQLASQCEGHESALVSAAEVVAICRAVLPVVRRGFSDHDRRVRRASAATAQQTTAALCRLLAGPHLPVPEVKDKNATSPRKVGAEVVMPLVRDLKECMPALVQALHDSDPWMRVMARRALEDLAASRLELAKYHRHEEGDDATAKDGDSDETALRTVSHETKSVEDPLLDALSANLAALAQGLDDPDIVARRSAIDVLETLGPAGAPAAPSLVKALGDRDRFVRWSAARTLGKMAPAAAREAVPALAGLLHDADMGVRLAAAGALERYGPDARGAVPGLAQTLSARDAQTRLAALVALDAIGPEARPAVPAIKALLGDADARVREYATEVLNQLAPEGKK